ncbi:hypothetical protein [Pedobacter punctiformis]|uniref:Uncharacterized protein n=1 Tax=Pedobacter punctiformis TaxID=3004097 RepID=A0ABT4L9V6_9SPHI|nr:hypothetical protein [Pedobacter sp. HCMS5-2]MCZ4244686.1 hypothetical protein [Pedobacter sp. HCMS5-2]
MNRLSLFLTGIICLLFISSYAQPIVGNGCMSQTSPKRVYQTYVDNGGIPSKPRYQPSSTGRYSEWTVQYDITQYPCYKWNLVSAGGCYYRTTYGTGIYLTGDYGYFTGPVTNCPIDNNTLFLLFSLGGIGCFLVRKSFLA